MSKNIFIWDKACSEAGTQGFRESHMIQGKPNWRGKRDYKFIVNAEFQGVNAFTTAALTRDMKRSASVPTIALIYPDYWPGHDGHL
jgi:hypothetical protein